MRVRARSRSMARGLSRRSSVVDRFSRRVSISMAIRSHWRTSCVTRAESVSPSSCPARICLCSRSRSPFIARNWVSTTSSARRRRSWSRRFWSDAIWSYLPHLEFLLPPSLPDMKKRPPGSPPGPLAHLVQHAMNATPDRAPSQISRAPKRPVSLQNINPRAGRASAALTLPAPAPSRGLTALPPSVRFLSSLAPLDLPRPPPDKASNAPRTKGTP